MTSFVKKCGAVAALVLAASGSAQAASVSCGNDTLGIRLTAVDPALVGGLCYAQNGNISGDVGSLFDIDPTAAVNNLTMIGKEVNQNGTAQSDDPLVGYTLLGATFGNWTVSETAWNTWGRVFLGFHFGGGGNTSADNPDSFIIELMATDNAGSWALTGTGAQITGLSNVYLFGKDRCTGNCVRDPQEDVPEPATLALVGLGLLGLGYSRRRKV